MISTFDHDTIFKEVAVLYAFKELNIQVSELPEQRIEEIKRLLNLRGDDIRDQLLIHNILPYSDDKLRDKIVLGATDPTDKAIAKITHSLNITKFEINFLQKERI